MAASASRHRTIAAQQVVFSFAVGADSSNAVDAVIRNAVAFTKGLIILHVSSNSRYYRQDTLDFVANQTSLGRVRFNPKRLQVFKHTPAVLAAHLSNWEYCSRGSLPCTREHGMWVLMSTNQVLFRHGIEEWIGRHGGGSSTWWQDLPSGLVALHEWATSRNLSALHIPPTVRVHPFIPRRVNNSRYAAAFARLFENRSMLPSGLQASPIVTYAPHEGSFYSFRVMRQFMVMYKGSIFDRVAIAQQTSQDPCPCLCHLYAHEDCGHPDKSGDVSLGCAGGCTFEETLLPTFAAQQAHPTAMTSPPVVLSATLTGSWPHEATVAREMAVGSLALDILGNRMAMPYLFGIKVPRHAFPATAAALKRVIELSTAEHRAASAEAKLKELMAERDSLRAERERYVTGTPK